MLITQLIDQNQREDKINLLYVYLASITHQSQSQMHRKSTTAEIPVCPFYRLLQLLTECNVLEIQFSS